MQHVAYIWGGGGVSIAPVKNAFHNFTPTALLFTATTTLFACSPASLEAEKQSSDLQALYDSDDYALAIEKKGGFGHLFKSCFWNKKKEPRESVYCAEAFRMANGDSFLFSLEQAWLPEPDEEEDADDYETDNSEILTPSSIQAYDAHLQKHEQAYKNLVVTAPEVALRVALVSACYLGIFLRHATPATRVISITIAGASCSSIAYLGLSQHSLRRKREEGDKLRKNVLQKAPIKASIYFPLLANSVHMDISEQWQNLSGTTFQEVSSVPGLLKALGELLITQLGEKNAPHEWCLPGENLQTSCFPL